jgi:ring-1,2-phenylacetyl-CoA epoxidase subunit PaaD
VVSQPTTSGRTGAPVDVAWSILRDVADPEMPALSVVDLGIVRTVEAIENRVSVTVTPTYSGCPATEVIVGDVRDALATAFDEVEVAVRRSPPWTTDWLSDAAREKLADHGIAPPRGSVVLPLFDSGAPDRCPQCGSARLAELAGFGPTRCTALWRCLDCREPFSYFKAH